MLHRTAALVGGDTISTPVGATGAGVAGVQAGIGDPGLGVRPGVEDVPAASPPCSSAAMRPSPVTGRKVYSMEKISLRAVNESLVAGVP